MSNLSNFFCKEPGNKCFRLCGVIGSLLQLFNSVMIAQKQVWTIYQQRGLAGSNENLSVKKNHGDQI